MSILVLIFQPLSYIFEYVFCERYESKVYFLNSHTRLSFCFSRTRITIWLVEFSAKILATWNTEISFLQLICWAPTLCLYLLVWGCRIVWCTLTSWYLVSLLPVSIIHVSVILLVGFWSWEISFIMWGCRGWGWQADGTWVSVSREMVGFPAPIGWPGASQSICTQ